MTQLYICSQCELKLFNYYLATDQSTSLIMKDLPFFGRVRTSPLTYLSFAISTALLMGSASYAVYLPSLAAVSGTTEPRTAEVVTVPSGTATLCVVRSTGQLGRAMVLTVVVQVPSGAGLVPADNNWGTGSNPRTALQAQRPLEASCTGAAAPKGLLAAGQVPADPGALGIGYRTMGAWGLASFHRPAWRDDSPVVAGALEDIPVEDAGAALED